MESPDTIRRRIEGIRQQTAIAVAALAAVQQRMPQAQLQQAAAVVPHPPPDGPAAPPPPQPLQQQEPAQGPIQLPRPQTPLQAQAGIVPLRPPGVDFAQPPPGHPMARARVQTPAPFRLANPGGFQGRAQNPNQQAQPNYRPFVPNPQMQMQQQQYGFQPQQQYPGFPQQGGGYDPYMGYGMSGANLFSGQWGQQSEGARQPVRFPALPLQQQAAEVDAACAAVASIWPEFPVDRVPGIFSVAQTGEILTVRAPRDGEEWMRSNPRQEEQRWSVLNSQIAVLSASRTASDRMMLDQFESLVQPTQFLEHLRKTMPMNEAQLDMVTTMHETMATRLNALEVFYKGGQGAVEEFMSSTLTGLDRKKHAALAKAKKSNPTSNGSSSRKRTRRGGGGGGPAPTTVAPVAAASPAAPQNSAPKCLKCLKFGHRTENCRLGT
jgi:hypothetical protein